MIEVLFSQFDFLYENLSRLLKSSITKCHFNLLESLLSLVLSVQDRVPLLVGVPVTVEDEEIQPAETPLPKLILHLIKNQDPKVRKILIDLVYSLYSLIPENMDEYSLDFWKLLKQTKTDKNKFVREASLACLKKFGAIMNCQQATSR